MYYKERENSLLYMHYQKQEKERLARKLGEIRSRKPKMSTLHSNEKALPPITHRPTYPRPCQKAIVEAETERLSKRIHHLKSNKSDYFLKVIKLNISGQWSRSKKTEETNKSQFAPNKEQKDLEALK